jgi:hypothetical protein
MLFNRAPENSNQYERACFGCEAGQARSLATPGKESADLRANRRACFSYEAQFCFAYEASCRCFIPILFFFLS